MNINSSKPLSIDTASKYQKVVFIYETQHFNHAILIANPNFMAELASFITRYLPSIIASDDALLREQYIIYSLVYAFVELLRKEGTALNECSLEKVQQLFLVAASGSVRRMSKWLSKQREKAAHARYRLHFEHIKQDVQCRLRVPASADVYQRYKHEYMLAHVSKHVETPTFFEDCQKLLATVKYPTWKTNFRGRDMLESISTYTDDHLKDVIVSARAEFFKRVKYLDATTNVACDILQNMSQTLWDFYRLIYLHPIESKVNNSQFRLDHDGNVCYYNYYELAITTSPHFMLCFIEKYFLQYLYYYAQDMLVKVALTELNQ